MSRRTPPPEGPARMCAQGSVSARERHACRACRAHLPFSQGSVKQAPADGPKADRRRKGGPLGRTHTDFKDRRRLASFYSYLKKVNPKTV